MKKLEVLEALKNQMDSFYSLEQVIKIIESIKPEESNVRNITVTDIGHAIEKFIDRIECGRIDVIDKNSAEFGIGYDNKIELENIDVDIDALREELEEIFMPFGEVDESNN
jgi:hypothetical protein